jgi:hypothetical protein
VLFDTTTVFLLFFMAKRFAQDSRIGWLAGLVYTFTPITFLMLSAGNLPNIFSQWILVVLLIVVLANWGRLYEPRVWSAALLLFVLGGVSHLGNLIVMTTLLLLIAGVDWLLAKEPSARRATRALLLLVAAGTIGSYLLYYADFTWHMFQEFQAVMDQKFGGGLRVAGTLDFAKVPVAISTVVIAGGTLGAFIGRRTVTPLLQRALLAWFVSAGLFVLAAYFVGVYVRYNVFVLPALSLGVGMGCVWLLGRSRWSYLAIAFYFAYVIWVGLSFWYQRVMYSYH